MGVDNVILFQFQNQDQKPVNITGSTFTFRIISQNGQDLLYAKELVSLNDALGRAKVTITAEDTTHFLIQPAGWSIEVSSGVLNQAVFTDDKCAARGDINIVSSVFPAFNASSILTIPTDQVGNNYVANIVSFYSSTLTTNGASLTTFQLDTLDYTGNIQVQGATDATMNTIEWYYVPFDDFPSGNAVGNLTFDHSVERVAFNVEGYYPYLRLQLNAFSNISNVGNVPNIGSVNYR
jgi:hypothetical protein